MGLHFSFHYRGLCPLDPHLGLRPARLFLNLCSGATVFLLFFDLNVDVIRVGVTTPTPRGIAGPMAPPSACHTMELVVDLFY